MGQIPQEGENGQNVFYFLFFWSSTEENFVCYILRMFFLVLAHLELKLGLFEVDDIGDDGDDDLWYHYLPQTALARVLDE